MSVSEGYENTLEVSYTLTRPGNDEAQLVLRQARDQDRRDSKVLGWVTRGASVTTPSRKFGELSPITPEDVGGRGNYSKLVSAGAISEATAELVGMNLGEYEYRVTGKNMPSLLVGPCVPSDRRIRSRGEGVNAEDFDQPAEEPYETWDEVKKRIVMREPRPAVDGRAICEELVEKGYLERVRIRDAAKAALKRRLTGSKSSSAE